MNWLLTEDNVLNFLESKNFVPGLFVADTSKHTLSTIFLDHLVVILAS